MHQMTRRRFLATMMMALPIPVLAACSTPLTSTQDTSAVSTAALPQNSSRSTNDAVARPVGWGEETHSNGAAPNYEIVFPQGSVNQLAITIAPENWKAMQTNMVELLGEQGSRQQSGGGGGWPGEGSQPPVAGEGLPPPGGRPVGGGRPEGGRPGGFGGGDFTPVNPMWVPATITFAGNTWTNVGVRYKGNSSLRSAWDNGTLKLPLKLDFDQFDGDYPEIKDQRFYGFKQLSLANGFGDSSAIRETVAYNLLASADLVAAETAFYEIIFDYGEGQQTLGLYTAIEVIDDTVIDRAFGGDSGNIYEGDGQAASLADGTFDQIPDSFQKENNETEADWSDVETLYTTLHAEERTTSPEQWRANLEAIFGVDHFLKWLGLSAIIQHWDTYGAMSHNYYLYHDPATSRLEWISWDHNFVLGGGGMGGRGGMGGPGGGGRGSSSLDKADVNERWPLIRYLLDDPTYYERYLSLMRETVDGVFIPEKLAETYQQLAALIRPFAIKEQSEEAFDAAITDLTERTHERVTTASEFLAA